MNMPFLQKPKPDLEPASASVVEAGQVMARERSGAVIPMNLFSTDLNLMIEALVVLGTPDALEWIPELESRLPGGRHILIPAEAVPSIQKAMVALQVDGVVAREVRKDWERKTDDPFHRWGRDPGAKFESLLERLNRLPQPPQEKSMLTREAPKRKREDIEHLISYSRDGRDVSSHIMLPSNAPAEGIRSFLSAMYGDHALKRVVLDELAPEEQARRKRQERIREGYQWGT